MPCLMPRLPGVCGSGGGGGWVFNSHSCSCVVRRVYVRVVRVVEYVSASDIRLYKAHY